MLADAVIFTTREALLKATAEHLKLKGVSNVVTPANAADCIDALNRFPKGLLVIDWACGQKEVVKALAYNRRRFKDEERPIMLVADQVDEKVVATAAEYHVSQVYSEEINVKTLGARLTNLVIAETMGTDVRRQISDATAARTGGDPKGALGTLQKLLAKHPTNLRIKCEVAETLMQLDEWDKAQKILVGMEAQKPPYLRGVHLLGRCMMKLGKFPEAFKVLEQAQIFNAHDVERLCDIGNILLEMDRVEEATEHFEAASELDPEFRDAKVGMGKAKLVDGDVNQALSILRDVSGDVELASLFNTAAVMNMRQGRHDGGMKLYQSALKALGKDQRLLARLYFNMGIGYRRWKKPEQAKEAFAKSAELDPKYDKAQKQIELMNGGKPTAAPLPKAAGDDDALSINIGGFGDFGGLDDDEEDDNLEESLLKF
jgi:tetratricopeptide (TPR) repeat protein